MDKYVQKTTVTIFSRHSSSGAELAVKLYWIQMKMFILIKLLVVKKNPTYTLTWLLDELRRTKMICDLSMGCHLQ